MIEEDMMVVQWGFASLLVVGLLLTAAFLCWLHEHDIHLSAPILKFLRRPIGEVLIVLACVGGLVQYGATKGFFGGPRMMAPREIQTELASTPESVDAVAGMFPSCTNAVTNVCATGILRAETSVFLRAHWPWNLHPAPTGIEVYAAPQLSTNAWVGVGTAPVTDGGNSTIIELPYSLLPDGWESSMFFMFGLNIDTDQDGLSDAFERIVTRTDPNLADTDGDGMSDGWEHDFEDMGFDPRMANADGASARTGPNDDLDGDGLSNCEECALGTDPTNRDTDGDGIDDGDEVGFVERLEGSNWYLFSTDDNLLDGQAATGSFSMEVALGTPVVINGVSYTNAVVDLDGVVYLLDPSRPYGDMDKHCQGDGDMTNVLWSARHVTLAGCCTDLCARPGSSGWGSLISCSSWEWGAFFEFEDLGHETLNATDSRRMHFQIVLPSAEPNIVYMNYLPDGVSAFDRLPQPATIGVQLPLRNILPGRGTYCGISRILSPEDSTDYASFKFHIGTGTSPIEADTDRDGLDDNEEMFVLHTDPRNQDTDGDGVNDGAEVDRGSDPHVVDSDGDGMPDGWEVENGLDPSSDDALSDLDGDGLPNVWEFRNGTRANDPDTDRDGLTDGEEGVWYDELPDEDWLYSDEYIENYVAYNWQDAGLVPCAMPFVQTLAGRKVSLAVADVNGVVHFGTPTTTNGISASASPPGGLTPGLGNSCPLVAGYWSDLVMRPMSVGTSMSCLSFGVVGNVTGRRRFVVEYDTFATSARLSGERIWFQVIIPENEANVAYVRHVDVTDLRGVGRVLIGAKGVGVAGLAFYDGATPPPVGSLCSMLKFHLGCGTNPLQPDTDGDAMLDGWEAEHGFDPTTDNAEDDEPDNDRDGDPDEDGLTNGQEVDFGTDPFIADSDGDGVSDGAEVAQASDPADASDGGVAGSRVPVAFTFGDQSGSHSEKYRLELTPVQTAGADGVPHSFTWTDAQYGVCETKTALLMRGCSYELRMFHAGTREGDESDYDYSLTVSHPQGAGVIVSDPSELIRADDQTSDYFSGEGKVAYVYVLGPMRLVPDFDGNGEIDQADEGSLDAGRTFRFWVNDDKDAASPDGDVARNSKILDDGNDDIPTSGSDGLDDEVNGRRDLVDFTPIRVDLSKTVGSFPDAIRNGISFRLRQDDGALNVVWSNLSPSGANSFQTARYTSGFGEELRSSPQDATTEQVVSGGLPLPSAFENRAKTGDGIFLVEGRHETTSPLVVEAIYENRVVCSNELRLSVTSVEDMYRWLGLRHVCGGQDLSGRSTAEPTNLPDRETVGPHYVFVHGYNVNAQSARGWAAEMFKRLWQAGARSKFTAVDWYGDESQFYLPTEGDVSPNYYINVEHAFMTAENLKNACAQLPGDKVMLAHSLGNMLVSAAAKDYDLQYAKYYMLNAAVPMEAYDVDAQNGLMIDGAWKDLGNRFRASHFYEAFASDPLDFRSKLSWKGRFAGIRNAINCYSPTEDVLKNPSQIKLFGVNVGEDYGGAWSKQELFKGCSLWYGVNSVTFAGTHIEGGWGVNANYLTRPLAYIPLVGFRASYFDGYTREDLITNALFTAFNDTRMALTNALNLVDSGLRAKMLGDAIPAESFAAGRNAINGVSQNFNFQGQNIPNWPKKSGSDNAWEHSDIKNVAYCFVHAIFDKMKRQD